MVKFHILGGIKGFASDKMNVTKWCLNRPKQAEIMKRLKSLCGMSEQAAKYKPLRGRKISKSESHVQKITEVLDGRFLNPFGAEVDQEDKVYNLGSGMPFKGDIEKLLKIKKDGQKLYDDFKSQRLHSNSVPFNARLPKRKPTLFSESKRKPKQKKNKSAEVIKANSNVLGKLLTLSANAQQPIDFQQALSYPLYDVSFI